MNHLPDPQLAADHGRRMRVLRLAVGLVALEAGLLIIARLMPALRVLMRPVYLVVAIAFALSLVQAARPRARVDRRHGDRRH